MIDFAPRPFRKKAIDGGVDSEYYPDTSIWPSDSVDQVTANIWHRIIDMLFELPG